MRDFSARRLSGTHRTFGRFFLNYQPNVLANSEKRRIFAAQNLSNLKGKAYEEITFTIGTGIDHAVNECPGSKKLQQLVHRQDRV